MADEYEGHWLSTLFVPKFDFLEPKEEDIILEDIAHALALLCRFGGHCNKFYSVAEHSVIVSVILDKRGADLITVLAGLLHDAEEAYLPDIPSPVKQLMPEALKMYETLNSAIIRKFKLEKADWEHIKDIDHRLVIAEAKALGIWNKEWADAGEPLEAEIFGWMPNLAKQLFLLRYKTLQESSNAP